MLTTNTKEMKTEMKDKLANATWPVMSPEDARVLDLADFMADVFEDREECFAVLSKALITYHHLAPAEDDLEGEGRMVLDLIDAIEIAECL